MPSQASKSDMYKWMLVEKSNLKVMPLDFLSVNANELMEECLKRTSPGQSFRSIMGQS
jgi:hypothetical protein